MRRPARHTLLRAALALSLVLNLCFIGGAVWTRMQAPTPHPGIAARFRKIEAGLALDPQQRQAFDRYTAAVESRARAMRRQITPLIGDAWTAMAKLGATPDDAMRVFDRVGAERHAFESDLTAATLAFFAHLSPEQRQKFVELVQRHTAARRR
jgi:uncharacterized membrane protein